MIHLKWKSHIFHSIPFRIPSYSHICLNLYNLNIARCICLVQNMIVHAKWTNLAWFPLETWFLESKGIIWRKKANENAGWKLNQFKKLPFDWRNAQFAKLLLRWSFFVSFLPLELSSWYSNTRRKQNSSFIHIRSANR